MGFFLPLRFATRFSRFAPNSFSFIKNLWDQGRVTSTGFNNNQTITLVNNEGEYNLNDIDTTIKVNVIFVLTLKFTEHRSRRE